MSHLIFATYYSCSVDQTMLKKWDKRGDKRGQPFGCPRLPLPKWDSVRFQIVSGPTDSCRGCLILFFFVLLFNSLSAFAQPAVTFEFESMFGQRGFYTRTSPPNEITPQGFTSPTGVTFLDHHRIVIADRGNSKLQSCDLEGNCAWIGGDGLYISGGTRHQVGTFTRPSGVEMNGQGEMAIADEGNHWLQLCDETTDCSYAGKKHGLRVGPASGLGQLSSPSDTAVDESDLMYVTDTGNNRIQVFNTDMAFRDVFGTSGKAPGQFNGPRGISIDPSGRIVISDAGNHRIQICDVDGNCEAFGGMGTSPGQFNPSTGVDVDGLGRIWVADTGNHRIQVCDDNGACVAFGGFGIGAGQFDSPSDLEVHSSGLVAVADTNNNRIQFFSTEPFKMNAGLNDAWYDPETDGQGFFITVFPDLGTVLLAWFTYDTELPDLNAKAILGDAGHRWLTALGPIDGNKSVMDIDIASGGLFDSPDPIEHMPGGTITLTFKDCNTGIVEYNILSIDRQGTVPIQRVANDNIGLCEALSAD